MFGPIGGGLDRLTQLVSKAEKKSENARRLRSRASNPRAGKAERIRELNGTPPNETGPFLVVTTRSLQQRLLVVTRERTRSESEPKGGHPTRRRATRPPPVLGACPSGKAHLNLAAPAGSLAWPRVRCVPDCPVAAGERAGAAEPTASARRRAGRPGPWASSSSSSP